MMDEHHNGTNRRTFAFDIRDLDNPVVSGHFSHGTTAIDHDLQIVRRRVFEANWRAGLRILNIGSLPGLRVQGIGLFRHCAGRRQHWPYRRVRSVRLAERRGDGE